MVDGKRGKPGSSYELMRDQLLDPFRIRKVLLTFDEGLFALPRCDNPYFAAALATAMNDYTVEAWLARDNRLAGSLIVPNQFPEKAVQEIHRLGRHPQVAQVIVAGSGLGPPLGHPIFHPIYEAACDEGLPLAVHVGLSGGHIGAGAKMNYYLEFHSLGIQLMMTHFASFLVNGVFEIFPDFKVIFLEGGVAWLPTLIWRLDAVYKKSWRELPNVNRLPSEYVADHMRFSSQPLELSPRREQMIKMLRLLGASKVMVFASDYPHWDADDVDYIAKKLPREWLARIYHDNACEFYGWPLDSVSAVTPMSSPSNLGQTKAEAPPDAVPAVQDHGDVI
jgi:hypothetical protein